MTKDTDQVSHSPLPWFSDEIGVVANRSNVYGHTYRRVARVHTGNTVSADALSLEGAANAAFIVTACNAHHALLEAAKHAAMEWRLHGQLTDSCRVLEAAIAKAEQK